MTARSPTCALAVVALAAAGCGGGGAPRSGKGSGAQRAVAPPAPTVVTTAASAPDSIPAPPQRLDAVPAAGTVRVADGPFNDKLRISALKLRRGERPAVSGQMLTISDVAEVLALTVDVAFYDRAGRLVATGRRSARHVEEFFDKPHRFNIRSTKPATRAAVAVVRVPEYVPE